MLLALVMVFFLKEVFLLFSFFVLYDDLTFTFRILVNLLPVHQYYCDIEIEIEMIYQFHMNGEISYRLNCLFDFFKDILLTCCCYY